MIKIDNNIKKILKESYEKNARLRDRKDIIPWKVKELDQFLYYAKKEDKHSLIDVGSGAGQYGKYLKDHGLEVTCVDLSEELVKICREKGLESYVMDFYNLNFEEEKFDLAWSLNTLLHVTKSSFEDVLKNIKRILKPKGLFYLGVYGGRDSEGIWEEDFYTPKRFFSFYEDNKIKDIVKKHFELVKFDVVDLGSSDLHFQSILLRKQ